jgi:type I restriction enzyme S subunit
MACARYLLMVLMSPWGQDHLVGGTTAVAQPNVNATAIAAIPVPVPPVAEQREIALRVEALFGLADGIEDRIRAATVLAERLPEAIVARPFRGELVPTEAELAAEEGRDYEPGSVLLKRIQKAREQNKPGKRGHGGKAQVSVSHMADIPTLGATSPGRNVTAMVVKDG